MSEVFSGCQTSPLSDSESSVLQSFHQMEWSSCISTLTPSSTSHVRDAAELWLTIVLSFLVFLYTPFLRAPVKKCVSTIAAIKLTYVTASTLGHAEWVVIWLNPGRFERQD